MTRWSVRHADLLDIAADGLLCSANPSLNLSGGIGGAILLKYGDVMQTFLHEQLRAQGVRTVPPGTVVTSPPFGLPHRAVAHAVAIDVFYETNADLIWNSYQTAFTHLAAAGCRSVAASCLGCGYGRFPASDFAAVARRLFASSIPNLDQVTLATTNRELAEVLEQVAVESLVARQIEGFENAELKARIKECLIPVQKQRRVWEWARAEPEYSLWIIANLGERNIGIAYADEDAMHFPGSPWGLVFLDQDSTGPASNWFRTLEECFAEF